MPLHEYTTLSSKHTLESCQELSQQQHNSTATGYCISYLHDGLLAVGCSNGYIQLLDAVKLTKIAILPTTPPIGHANITNIQVNTLQTNVTIFVCSGQNTASLHIVHACTCMFTVVHIAQ